MKIDIENITMFISKDDDTIIKLMKAIAYIYYIKYDLDKQIDQCIDYKGLDLYCENKISIQISKN